MNGRGFSRVQLQCLLGFFLQPSHFPNSVLESSIDLHTLVFQLIVFRIIFKKTFCFFSQLSYSPNIGELSQNGSQNVFHLFPSQMDPTAISALLNLNGWRRVAILTERNTQIEVSDQLMMKSSPVYPGLHSSFSCLQNLKLEKPA